MQHLTTRERQSDLGLFPTSFDGEPGGAFYPEEALDRRLESTIKELDGYRRTNLDNFAGDVIHEPGYWAEVRDLLDALAERGERRRWVLEVDAKAVAKAQLAHVAALLKDIDDPNAGGSPGWREEVVKGMLASLAVDERLDPAERSRYAHLAEEVTR